MSTDKTMSSIHYPALLAEIRQRIQSAQTRAMLGVNAALIRLYWEIGQMLDARQKNEGWGAAVIPRLARDIHNDLPEVKGFSERNIKRMLAFYREYAGLEFVPQAVAQIEPTEKVPQAVALFSREVLLALPWGHHLLLMETRRGTGTCERHWPTAGATICRRCRSKRLPMPAMTDPNGKQRLIDCANIETIFRVIQ